MDRVTECTSGKFEGLVSSFFFFFRGKPTRNVDKFHIHLNVMFVLFFLVR